MYRVFLTDGSGYVELDTEDISIETVFAVSDISDIDSRKDAITKNIAFKGTQTNNKAFGSLYFLNRNVDVSLDKSIFFNYSPLKRVDCQVFEDSMLILIGYLIVTDVDVDAHGAVTYNATITGKLIGFKQALADRKLSDLDFSDLKHQYTKDTIQNSWGASALDSSLSDQTQRYDSGSDTFVNKPFELGSGYVYPFIDYGNEFQTDDFNKDYSNIYIHNYRPAIYVKEYLSRIFQGVGYTYEVKGDSDFVDRFNRLVIPDSNESITTEQNTDPSYYSIGVLDNIIQNSNTSAGIQYFLNILPINTKNGTPLFTTYSPLKYGENKLNNCIIQFTRTVTTSFSVHVKLVDVDNTSNGLPASQYVIVEFAKRAYTTDTSGTGFDSWDIIASQQQILDAGATDLTLDFDISALSASFNFGDQVSIRVKNSTYLSGAILYSGVTYTVRTIELKFPANENEYYTIEVASGDTVIPKVPVYVKQYDFLRSTISLFNLYVYNTKQNPYHLILQPYDNYYSACKAPGVYASAIDWTKKIDYSKNVKISGNINLPKKYVFTFTEDGDYLNKTYNDKYGEVFSTKTLSDSLGTADTKTVQVIFSPTPMIQIPGQNMYYGFMGDGGTSLFDKKPTETNIRILFYNGGAFSSNSIKYSEDSFDEDTVPTVTSVFQTNVYGQASNYHFGITNELIEKSSTFFARYDIHFSHPDEIYFKEFGLISFLDDSLPTSYSYYQNQIGEMTGLNIFTIECDALLNAIDIGNLDLSQPVFINMGEMGYSYFKVLQVDYANSDIPGTIQLQKIVL